ncbi:MAG: OmpP1/FadL family transporter [Myxococcaceae bacterium]
MREGTIRRFATRLPVVLLLCGTGALANNMQTFGFGPRAAAMAGAQTADAQDYSAVFYNPAMLVLRKDLNFGFAFSWARADTEVAPTGTGATADGPQLDCKYCTPPDSAGFSVGLLFPLAGKVKNRLAFGLGLYLPSQRLLRTQATDPNRPFWYLYHSSPDRIIVHAGAGLRILENLTFGVGVQALADLVGQGASMEVDLFSKQVKAREIDSTLATRTGPTAGLYFAPLPQVRLGVSFRWEMALLYQIPAEVDLEGIGTLAFKVEGMTHYSPHTLNFGAAWDITPEVTVAVDGEYAMWSRAPSPYVDVTVDISGDTLAALGLGSALDLNSPRTAPGFTDTFTGRVGLEYRMTERFAARGGAYYRPTPVPRQDVPGTNILDASAVGLSVGAGFSFDDPLEVFEAPVSIDLAGQGTFLLPREAVKEPTDVVPSYKYSATLYGLTAAIRYEF